MVDWGGDDNFADDLVDARNEIKRLRAELARSQERVHIQAGMLAEVDAMKSDLAAAREVIGKALALDEYPERWEHLVRPMLSAFLELAP